MYAEKYTVNLTHCWFFV